VTSLRQSWLTLRASLWFVPSLIVLASMAAALVLVERTGLLSDDLARQWPRIFGAGADGSREMLAAIATSMITVAGVVFSITIVALAQSSTQYSPRVLRNFMRDTPTQVVLGVFVGNFAYCLLVLRTVRGGDQNTFIPALAVLGAMVYVFLAISLLIYFIHHVAQSIQASSILARIFDDAVGAIEQMFPDDLGDSPEQPAVGHELPDRWRRVHAQNSGYVTAIASGPLMELALETGRIVRLKVGVGGFIAQGSPIAELSGQEDVPDAHAQKLRRCITLGRQRTPEQDPAFGIQQLVDVAVKALSPGINDPTTACMCLDQIGALVLRLSHRKMPSPYRMRDGALRVIAPAPDYAGLVALAFNAVILQSRGDLQVLVRVLDQLEAAERCVGDAQRRRSLSRAARAVMRHLRRPDMTVDFRLTRSRARRLALTLR
jgi:uncharacterized membrane protein